MKKLELKDIEILGEGHQIRRYIETTHGKLEDFFNKTNFPVCLKSVRTYLSQEEIKSDTFKHSVVRILDKGYDELTVPMTTQIKKYVWDIFDNIKLYRDENDYKIFDLILDFAKKKQMSVETAMMYRAKAMNCYYRNRINGAIEWYEKAIEELDGDIYINKLVLMIIELADVCYRENKLERASTEYKKAEAYVETHKISDDILFKYYYWRGIMFNNVSKHAQARICFTRAYNCTNIDKEKTASMLNIALAYRREAKLEDALDHYNKALCLYSDSDLIGRGAIYNNIAYMYLESGDLKEALENSIKSLALVAVSNDLYSKVLFTNTFTRIQLRMEDISSCNEYFDVLRSTINKQLDKRNIVEDIKAIIEDLNDIELLEELSGVIAELIDNTDNEDYEMGLYVCMGKIKKKQMLLKSGRV